MTGTKLFVVLFLHFVLTFQFGKRLEYFLIFKIYEKKRKLRLIVTEGKKQKKKIKRGNFENKRIVSLKTENFLFCNQRQENHFLLCCQ